MNDISQYEPLIRLRGRKYVEVLRDTHLFLKPSNYLEIGVSTGATLELASCISLAVDPRFKINVDVIKSKQKLHLFQQTSDEFFASNDLTSLLGAPLALGFLDGLHYAEFLLRDIMNAERYCDSKSVLILHDCIPVDIYMARRSQIDPAIQRLTPTPGAWTGDVWKTLAVLRKLRKDLHITCLDAGPTGLVYITGLDAKSNLIKRNYDAMLSEMEEMVLTPSTLADFLASLTIVSTNEIDSERKMREVIFRSETMSPAGKRSRRRSSP